MLTIGCARYDTISSLKHTRSPSAGKCSLWLGACTNLARRSIALHVEERAKLWPHSESQRIGFRANQRASTIPDIPMEHRHSRRHLEYRGSTRRDCNSFGPIDCGTNKFGTPTFEHRECPHAYRRPPESPPQTPIPNQRVTIPSNGTHTLSLSLSWNIPLNPVGSDGVART